MLTFALTALCGLLIGLWWGERTRRLDLLHVRRYQEERPPMNPVREAFDLVVPTIPPEPDREISSEEINRATTFLRREAEAMGRAITPEEAERQARLMLAGEDV